MPMFARRASVQRVRSLPERLFARFPELSLAAEPTGLRWHSGLIMRGLHELPVRTRGPGY